MSIESSGFSPEQKKSSELLRPSNLEINEQLRGLFATLDMKFHFAGSNYYQMRSEIVEYANNGGDLQLREQNFHGWAVNDFQKLLELIEAEEKKRGGAIRRPGF